MTRVRAEYFKPIDEQKRTKLAAVNPYILEVTQSDLLPIVPQTQLPHLRGEWLQYFASDVKAQGPSALVLEIGCHFGKTLESMAYHNQEIAFVGLDITYKRVVKSARRVKALANARVAHMDARALSQVFAPKELNGCVIFFPDPWNKVKKRKHRLLSEPFLEELTRCVASWIWLRTDVEAYFDEVSAEMIKLGWKSAQFKTEGLYTSSFQLLFAQDSQKSVYETVFIPQASELDEDFEHFFTMTQTPQEP
jgi:tRNA G46 methylase TrmB